MWIRGIHSGLVAQVTNPEDVTEDYHYRWEYAGNCWPAMRETVDISQGFKFPDDWRDEPGTDCFTKVKRKRFWRGLKVRWDDSIGYFKTV